MPEGNLTIVTGDNGNLTDYLLVLELMTEQGEYAIGVFNASAVFSSITVTQLPAVAGLAGKYNKCRHTDQCQ